MLEMCLCVSRAREITETGLYKPVSAAALDSRTLSRLPPMPNSGLGSPGTSSSMATPDPSLPSIPRTSKSKGKERAQESPALTLRNPAAGSEPSAETGGPAPLSLCDFPDTKPPPASLPPAMLRNELFQGSMAASLRFMYAQQMAEAGKPLAKGDIDTLTDGTVAQALADLDDDNATAVKELLEFLHTSWEARNKPSSQEFQTPVTTTAHQGPPKRPRVEISPRDIFNAGQTGPPDPLANAFQQGGPLAEPIDVDAEDCPSEASSIDPRTSLALGSTQDDALASLFCNQNKVAAAQQAVASKSPGIRYYYGMLCNTFPLTKRLLANVRDLRDARKRFELGEAADLDELSLEKLDKTAMYADALMQEVRENLRKIYLLAFHPQACAKLVDVYYRRHQMRVLGFDDSSEFQTELDRAVREMNAETRSARSGTSNQRSQGGRQPYSSRGGSRGRGRGRGGHSSRSYRSSSGNGYRDAGASTSSGSTPRMVTCFICGQQGHMAPACPQKTSAGQGQ